LSPGYWRYRAVIGRYRAVIGRFSFFTFWTSRKLFELVIIKAITKGLIL
jgi:hypothetical protein